MLGIEDYVNGTLLNYINELGYIALGYEAGQHDDPRSIGKHIVFIYPSLVFAGSPERRDVDFDTPLLKHAATRTCPTCTRSAMFLARDIVHVLGYRSRQVDGNHLIIKNREDAARNHEYDTASWSTNRF